MTPESSHNVEQVRAPLVFSDHDGDKAVMCLITAVRREAGKHRLCFRGPTTLDSRAVRHVRNTILPIVDRILAALGVSRRNLVLSITNLAAAAARNVALKVSGFSADAAIFLVMISVLLRMSLREGLAVTGHIGSAEGHIRVVKGLPEKLAAAIQAPGISAFAYPALDADESMKALAPTERERMSDALVQAKGHIRIVAVDDIFDLVRECFDGEAMAVASLRSGYYEHRLDMAAGGSPVASIAALLGRDNPTRFREALEKRLLEDDWSGGRRLLTTWAAYYLRRGTYPEGEGRYMWGLMQSLPPALRRLKGAPPLLVMKSTLALAALAGRENEADAALLIQACRGAAPAVNGAPPDGSAVLARVIKEISADTLARKIGIPIDSARVAFPLGSATVAAYDELLETLVSFWRFMLRRTGVRLDGERSIGAPPEFEEAAEAAFRDLGGWRGAASEARSGTHGGLLLLLNRLGDHYKQKRIREYVSAVFKAALDPMDSKARTDFAAALVARLGPALPPELTDLTPESLALHTESLAKAYVASLDRVRDALRAM